MIINLKKYRKHGYLKALALLVAKMFLRQNQKITIEKKINTKIPFTNYPKLIRTQSDETLCISCDLCQQYCPQQCILIKSPKKSEDLKTGPSPSSFVVNLSECTRCQLCLDICPADAISMQGSYQLSDFSGPVDLLNN